MLSKRKWICFYPPFIHQEYVKCLCISERFFAFKCEWKLYSAKHGVPIKKAGIQKSLSTEEASGNKHPFITSQEYVRELFPMANFISSLHPNFTPLKTQVPII